MIFLQRSDYYTFKNSPHFQQLVNPSSSSFELFSVKFHWHSIRMANFMMFGIFLISLVVFNSVECSNNKVADLNVEVITLQNFTKFSSFQVSQTDNSWALSLLTYAAGKRLDGKMIEIKSNQGNSSNIVFSFTGDHLVQTVSNSSSWTTPDDRRLTVKYPKSGTGAVITYIQVFV